MSRYIVNEYERLGIDDLEDIDLLKEMGLTTAAYPEYDEDIIEAVMNMLDVDLKTAIKIWDNDNTRFDYYESVSIDPMYPFVSLAEHRIDDLEEIEANNDDCGCHFSEEIMELKTRIDSPEEVSIYLTTNGWMIHEDVAIGWDIDKLGQFLEAI